MQYIYNFSIPIIYRSSTVSWEEREICENDSWESHHSAHGIIANDCSTGIKHFSSESGNLFGSIHLRIDRISYEYGLQLPYILSISPRYYTLRKDSSISRYITLDYHIFFSIYRVFQSIISDDMSTCENRSITSSDSHSSHESRISLIFSDYFDRLIWIMSTGCYQQYWDEEKYFVHWYYPRQKIQKEKLNFSWIILV
jgi:hypothetical protein